jgi:squalene synthase HpnC
VTLLADAPFLAPAPEAVMARAQTENFPVASRVLPRAARAHLLAIYGYARLVDELGDTAEGDRLAALDWLEGELDAAFEGRAGHPLLIRLTPTLRECGLRREPFMRLIEANRLDQRRTRYASWEELRAYCRLSADPVGELVLEVLGQSSPERIELSDRICTALQLTEHCQDVGEDHRAGRIYLPLEDLERFGCSIDELSEPHSGPALRAVVGFEVSRARALFDEGAPLIGELRGRARFAIAAFVAGGRAALDALERTDLDVLRGPPPVGRMRLLASMARTLASSQARAR